MSVRRLLSALLCACMIFARPAYALEDAIMAVVNDEVITVKDLQIYLQGIIAQLRIEGKTPAEAQEIMQQYQAKGIEQLVDDRLILSAADKMGVQIRPKAIEERFDEIKKRYPSYQEFLTAIKHEGITVTDIKKKIENQLKGQVAVNTEVREKVYVNPQEVTDYFNAHADEFRTKSRVFLETIFVKSAFGRDEAKKKAEQALNRIRQGEDFKIVSAELSELPSVGEISKDQLRPEFKDKIDLMKIGDVSDIIEVTNGFYILKLEGRAEASTASLNDVKDVIYQRLFEEKFRVQFKSWIEKLRKKAYVEIKS